MASLKAARWVVWIPTGFCAQSVPGWNEDGMKIQMHICDLLHITAEGTH